MVGTTEVVLLQTGTIPSEDAERLHGRFSF